MGNFRPISILPILSKILEKIVSKQLTQFLEGNKLLSNSQHGFRPRLSTETALTTVTDAIYDAMDNGKISLLSLCDLSKAFDSVKHNILLDKCFKLKIDSFWFTSYLMDRTQSVKINNSTSSIHKVEYGVPQGSILGPILFNIFVNDLPEHAKNCLLVQYADDTQFLHTGTIGELETLIKNTEDTLRTVRLYFLTNGLMLNSSKTQCIFIGNRQLLAKIPMNTTINIDTENIVPSVHLKNLGLYMDKYMLFDKHVSELIKKIVGILMFLNRSSSALDKSSRITVAQTLALSRLNTV